ncbi:hypothetical protein F5Y10DRAFT_260882 [Nemania abortiva]|nr:hypothetical protein F5Y10DRAFT_260882 [Nemania abortiva]
MSNRAGNVCQDNTHTPSPSDSESVPEQSHESIGPQNHCAILPRECPVSLARASLPSTRLSRAESIVPNCDAPAKFGAGPTFEGKDAPWLWRHIALNNWTPQATTLIALVIMLADVILERGSVPRDKAAHPSILRATSEGPIALVSLILSSGKLKTIARAEFILGLFLLAGTAAIQFSSTILLSDIFGSNLVGDVAVVPVRSFAFPNQQRITTTQHLYSIINPAFAIYGERRSNTTVIPNSDGLSDTGIIDRVLLPIGKPEDRTSVRNYDGVAIVFSSRVVCMRPEIRNLELDRIFGGDKGSNFGQLNATLDYGLSLKKAGVNGSCGSESCPSFLSAATWRVL